MKGLFLSSLSFTSFCAGHQKYDNMGGGDGTKSYIPPSPQTMRSGRTSMAEAHRDRGGL